jgi:PDZ domain
MACGYPDGVPRVLGIICNISANAVENLRFHGMEMSSSARLAVDWRTIPCGGLQELSAIERNGSSGRTRTCLQTLTKGLNSPAKQEADTGVNAGDLVLIRLEEKSKRRQFEVGAQGLWRGSSGISITHQVQVFRSEEKLGVYKIIASTSLKKGEYALYVTRGNGLSPYVYDFSVEGENTGTRSTYQPEITSRNSAADNEPADSSAQNPVNGSTPSVPAAATNAASAPQPTPAAVESAIPRANTEPKLSTVPNSLLGDTDQEPSIGAWFGGKPTARHDGVEVAGVQHGGAVDEIGVKAGDFILAIDDHYVFTIHEFHDLLLTHAQGSRVVIRYRRHSLIYDTFIKIGPR